MFIGPCIIVIVEEWKTNLMSLAILFHFVCAQHVSDNNISIIRSLQLCCWITTGWSYASACKMNTTKNQPHQSSNTQRTENKTTDVVIQQHSRKLLMIDILMSEICWAHKKWNKVASDIKLVFHSSTQVWYLSLSSYFAVNTDEPVCIDIGLCDTLSITSDILLCQLTPHC